jgi:hypothetical protein
VFHSERRLHITLVLDVREHALINTSILRDLILLLSVLDNVWHFHLLIERILWGLMWRQFLGIEGLSPQRNPRRREFRPVAAFPVT